MDEFKTWSLFDENDNYLGQTNDDGQFEIISDYEVGTVFHIYYHYGESDQQMIEYVRQTNCCRCEDLIFTYGERYYNTSAHTVVLGTIEFADGSNDCLDSIEVTYDENFTNVYLRGNEVIGEFGHFTQTFEETGRRLEFDIKLNGNSCGGPYEIYQQAWKGTDNGTDTFVNGFQLTYPIILCGCISEDHDSIVSNNGAWYYNKSRNSFDKIDANWEGVVIDGWCHFYFKNEEGQHSLCGNGNMISCSAITRNESSQIRTASIILTSVDNKNGEPTTLCGGEHPGEECALKWEYTVWQLPLGKSMCYADDGKNFELIDENADCSNPTYNKEDCKNKTEKCVG